jgi:DNA-binding NarL/FixJ family response regulator
MHANEEQTAVVLDEHPLWLDAVEGVLNRIGIRVTGKATSPSQALTLVEDVRPDLLVAELPDSNGGSEGGASFLAKVRQLVPHLRAIVLSVRSDSHHIEAALEAGAAAYVVKTTHPDDLAAAVRQSFNHSIYLAGTRATPPAISHVEADENRVGLTRREREILQLVAEGHSNAQLARMLWVTEQTVKFHLSNIYRKLDVSNRTEASRWAQLNGLLPSVSARQEPNVA